MKFMKLKCLFIFKKAFFDSSEEFLKDTGPFNLEKMSLLGLLTRVSKDLLTCCWLGEPPKIRRKGNLMYWVPALRQYF